MDLNTRTQLEQVLQDLADSDVLVTQPNRAPCDCIVSLGSQEFCVKSKAAGSVSSIVAAIDSWGITNESCNRLIVVPYMSQAAAKYCQGHGISWVDLSGNAKIQADGVLIASRGNPNRFAKPREKVNAFAPKSSRVVHELLKDPATEHSQKELVELVGLTQGLVSRLVRTLRETGYLTKERTIHVKRPNALLAAWREAYQFDHQEILMGHAHARSGVELLSSLSESLQTNSIKHSATGLSGAWLWDQFATFRLVTLYVERHPSKLELDAMNVRPSERGANVWLVCPRDAAMLARSTVRDGIPCQDPLQIYLDLQSHPERAKEAADELRLRHLNWQEDE